MKISADEIVGLVDEEAFLNALPAIRTVPPSEMMRAIATSSRRLVVLDDDPTGTQTIANVPVLTTWDVPNLRWALSQNVATSYVLTNTRSLVGEDAKMRIKEVMVNVIEAARLEGVEFVIASRSDSTLRGHFPLETDVLIDSLAHVGLEIDGVVIVPAYIEAGRFTVDSIHWVRTPDGLIRAGESEFSRDATFGYVSSDLREYVVEKTFGRVSWFDVARITIEDLRIGGVERVVEILRSLSGAQTVVVDATNDQDLRVLALAVIEVENTGTRLVYRVGPSFVRARAGIESCEPLSTREVSEIVHRQPYVTADAAPHGLIVVGSHVAQTTRQLRELEALGDVVTYELDVEKLLDPEQRATMIANAIGEIVANLELADVMVVTSRTLVRRDDAVESLAVATSVSVALVDVVRGIRVRRIPRWIVAKGGNTSSDVATRALEIRRAWVRGSMLPGIISLWVPVAECLWTMPYVVFAGNVGDDQALVKVVLKLRGREKC